MRVLIIGGSGRTGKLVIDELLQRGHEVTALVRTASSLDTKPGVQIVTGTPTKKDDVLTAFRISNPQAVLVTLSAPRASDSPFAAPISPPRLMADSNANIVAAMTEFGTSKIVIMQAFGVGESWPHMHWTFRMLMSKSNMSLQYDDHNLVADELKASGVNYVMVRPARLVEGEVGDVLQWPNDGKGVPMMATVTRASVAKFLVEATESRDWDGSSPVITN